MVHQSELHNYLPKIACLGSKEYDNKYTIVITGLKINYPYK